MSAVQPFDYNGAQVRTLLVDNEPWFVASDVAKILGYRMASDMTRRIDNEDRGTRSVRTPSGDQDMTVISEPGLYVAVLGSQVEGARAFKRWITHEVLPAIRKTGSYAARPAELTRSDLARMVLEAEEEKKALEAKVEADAPKVEYVERFVAEADNMTFRTVASTLNVGEHELRELLIEAGWIYRETSERWSNKAGKKVPQYRYSEMAHKKAYFIRRENHDAPRFRGELDHTLKITPAGAQAIARLIQRRADSPAVAA